MSNQTSQAPAPTFKSVEEYVNKLAQSSPQEAVQIALAERGRAANELQRARTEQQAMAELEFDDQGRIVKANLAGLFKLAGAYATAGEITPVAYRGNQSACFVACQMAFRLKVDAMAYMQNSYIVHGKPGMEAKFQIAMLNTSGKIKGRVRYRDERDPKTGKIIASTAYCFDAETGEEVCARVDSEMVKAEGWSKNTKWNTLPDLMFHYRAGSFLIRQYYPEVTLGMPTVEELRDLDAVDGVVVEKASIDALTEKLGVAPNSSISNPEIVVVVKTDEKLKTDVDKAAQDAGNGNESGDMSEWANDPKNDAARK